MNEVKAINKIYGLDCLLKRLSLVSYNNIRIAEADSAWDQWKRTTDGTLGDSLSVSLSDGYSHYHSTSTSTTIHTAVRVVVAQSDTRL